VIETNLHRTSYTCALINPVSHRYCYDVVLDAV
jgi:hypothetical protein